MSQNDTLLKQLGVPILNKEEKCALRKEWQNKTWDDMVLSLSSYQKYIMLRPTGFGKTFTCAASCNIGAKLHNGQVQLNNGKIINNENLASIYKKKVIFVYISEILKRTFNEYVDNGIIKNGKERVQYETYASVALNWGDRKYLEDVLDIKNVGLIIFDEAQRMGARGTSKVLDKVLPILSKLGVYYIGATATVERSTGHDVCDRYFTYRVPDTENQIWCWGSNTYDINKTFEQGLLIPPYYQYILDDPNKIKLYRGQLRQTKQSIVQELKLMSASDPDREILLKDMKELQNSVIKNASKIIHDSLLTLYNCSPDYIDNNEELDKAEKNSIECPKELPSYMRFLVFAPNTESLKSDVDTIDDDGNVLQFKNMVARTHNDFFNAFARYGYRIRTTIVSSANKTEKENVNLIDNYELAKSEQIAEKAAEKLKLKTKTESDIEIGKAVVPQDKVIDLIFSINMLNVGYHVNHITGLVFKRWTASNQIYLQQLGRCLSSVSDSIPIVFDFVNALSSRGVAAPLYTYDRGTNKITENADGTILTEFRSKKNKKANTSKYRDMLLDNQGNAINDGINPLNINHIQAKYILMDTKTASIEDITSRYNVYTERKVSKDLYEKAYKNYMNDVGIQGNKLITDVYRVRTLSSALRNTIYLENPDALKGNFTINFKAYAEYLRLTEKEIYVLYDALDRYLKEIDASQKSSTMTADINTILAMSKTQNSKGLSMKMLLDADKIQEYKSNEAVRRLLHSKAFNERTDIILYKASRN